MHRMPLMLVGSMVVAITASIAQATDIPITGLKLIVVDKLAAASKAKAVFVAKDASITKGTGTDPAQMSAVLHVAYDTVSGVFVMGQGANWLVNSPSVGKYVNKDAPLGLGVVKVSVVKPGLLVKVVAKSLGGTPLDISSAPTGTVYVVDTVVNGAETTRLCTQFTGCEHRTIASGTGYKLVCKDGTGDAACTAAVSTFSDLGDGTVYDSATDLQWEQKTTTVGSGVNAADLHDVDNRYSWAGQCSVATSKYCQPNLAAETACKAQTDAANWGDGCEQCVGGEGTCTVSAPAITTVWDWLSQVNTANYAGHSDWRLPSESGCNACYTGLPRLSCTSCSAHELETILLSGKPCFATPCIDSIFGPTVANAYWSSSTWADSPTYAWSVDFFTGGADAFFKTASGHNVRAVRGGS